MARLNKSHRVSPYAAVLAPAVWGSTYLVATQWLPPGAPMFDALLRALPAGIVLLLLTGGSLPRGGWLLRAFALGTLNIGLFFALLFVAAYRLPGGTAAMVIATQPLIVVLLSAVLLGIPIRLVHIGASVLGMVGVLLLLTRSRIHLDAIGIVAAAGAATSMAAGIVLTKKWGRPVPLLVFTAWQLLTGGLVLLIPTLLTEGVPAQITPVNLLGYLYLGLIGSCVAYAVWFRGIEQLSAAAVSFLGLVSPLVATALGYLYLHQGLTGWQIAGAACVLLAVLAGQLPPTATAAHARTSSGPARAPNPSLQATEEQ
ncbi:MAG TPA: EamA family transporter [Solirubrobacteraceae bacterium]|jgi:probable blue pigment (indigoidine) exporter